MGRQVILDQYGDNPQPKNCAVATDDVAFLRLAAGDGPLFVRGQTLCQWAEDLAVGRAWDVTWLRSPTQELVEQCPSLNVDGAAAVLASLGEALSCLPRPLHLTDVMESLWPEMGLWSQEPGAGHGFRWLYWMAESAPGGPDHLLVLQQASIWQAFADQPVRPAYLAKSSAEAWSSIREWLGLAAPRHEWPQSPTSLDPTLVNRLKKEMLAEALATETDYFAALVSRAVRKDLLVVAAETCASVLLAHSHMLTAERVARLKPYLPHDQWQHITTVVPPANPGMPEWRFDDLREWLVGKYLPYREWTTRPEAGSKSSDWAQHHATDFATAFLRYYADARVNGEGREHLAWVKRASLSRSKANCVYLVVVLDGLAYPDAQRLKHEVLAQTVRLALDHEDLALAPLPTVTEFAKPAVAKGIAPFEAVADTLQHAHSTAEQVMSVLQSAAPGDILVWTLQEPDKTYHFGADSGPITLRHGVDAQLSSIAGRIASVVQVAPPHVPLRVVVTTDHGRLLTIADRSLPIPAGMAAHGRAAWGPHEVTIDETGVLIDGEIAYLHPSRFGLPDNQAYAVVLSEKAFLTADSRGGAEPYPHGGLFPEEVLVPWIEFVRDRGPIKIEVVLRGKGQEGRSGTAELVVTNLSDISVKLTSLTVGDLAETLQPDTIVGPISAATVPVRLPVWPSSSAVAGLTGCLVYALPDGELAKQEFTPTLETETLYDRPDILSDLGGL